MRASKKGLGVIVVLAMLVNSFAMFSFAAAPDTAIDLSLKTDKASYSAGDIVTFTVHEKVIPEVGDMMLSGAYGIGYNSAIFSTINEAATDTSALGVTAIQSGYDESSSVLNREPLEKGITEGMGWDKSIVWSIADDMTTTFDATAGVDLFTFQMKIADDAPDGDYIVGFNKPLYDASEALVANADGEIFGNSKEEAEAYGFTTNNIYGCGTVTVHVGAPVAEGPVVARAGAQVKFTPDSTTGNGVADKFMFRVKSVISARDWNTYFANTAVDGATTNTITAVGMVAIPEADASDGVYNKELATQAAEAAIKNPDFKGEAGVYKAASTTYIHKAEGENTDAYFGAIINISHENCASNIRYIGFVQYNDADGNPQIIFYNNAELAKVTAQDYDALVNRYKLENAAMFPA